MIISASRRTDIPRFFSPWFFRRLQEGFVLVRNPMNPRRISRVSLDSAVVDGSADAAVQALLDGTLQFDPAVHCDHHGDHHGEGHACGHQGGAASCHQGGCGH